MGGGGGGGAGGRIGMEISEPGLPRLGGRELGGAGPQVADGACDGESSSSGPEPASDRDGTAPDALAAAESDP